MKTNYRLAISLIVLTSIAANGYATLINESATTKLQPTDFKSTLALGLFDASLGQLNDVQITVTGELVGGLQSVNGNDGEDNSYGQGTATYTLSQTLDIFQGARTMLTMSDVTTKTVNLQGLSNSEGDQGNQIQAVNDTNFKVYDFTAASDLSQYIGKGRAIFTINATSLSSDLTAVAPKGVNLNTYSLANATIAIAYTYSPLANGDHNSGDGEDGISRNRSQGNTVASVISVPEPSTGTIILLGLAFFGLVAIRRRISKM